VYQVTAYPPTRKFAPAVAAGTGGAFVVVWTSRSQDGMLGGVFGQRFSGSGAPQGSEFRINSYTTGDQRLPAVAADASGRFVVVWSSYYEDGSGAGIFGRRFDASGMPQGGEFQVNTYTTGPQTFPSVASDASGNFVVVWHGSGQDGSGYGIRGRRFDAAGGAQGGEFLVNAYTSGNQLRPRVAAAADGRFTVVWNSSGQDGSSIGVFGRRFDAAGAAQGAEFRANSYTLGAQRTPAVASDPQGDFVVVWDSLGQYGDLTEVFGQRYGDLIFADGLESGDLARWSSASTGGGDLTVSGGAAMGGTTHGLEAFVNDTGALYVQDATPEAETRYRARFYFDPNGFDPGEADSHFRTRIFIAFDPTGLRLVTLVLKRQAGAFSLEGRVRRNDGTRADTGFFPITDGPHAVEIDWRRSTGPGAVDGAFEMWIDNVSVATLAGIDNDSTPIDFARMGAIAVKTAAFGTLYYDQFESRRQRLIGP
jgi:hypothetical protein